MKLGDGDFAAKDRLNPESDRLDYEAVSSDQRGDAERPSSKLIMELKQRYRQIESFVNAEEAINADIDKKTEKAEVEQRIRHLEAILEERGHL